MSNQWNNEARLQQQAAALGSQPQQWQTFTPPQHPHFNPLQTLLYGMVGWFIGSLFDNARQRRYEERVIAPAQERKRVNREKYIVAYQAWDREYGDTYRQGLPCPPAPTYQPVAGRK